MTLDSSLARLAKRAFLAAGAVALASSTVAQHRIYHESNGLVAIEFESLNPVGQWVEETQWQGFTGDSYFRWNGPNMFSTPGDSILRYQFHVSQGGTYNLRIRNRHNHPDSSEENDVWVRLDGSPWIKCYSNAGPPTVNVWTWVCTFETSNHQHVNPEYTMAPGHHTIEFSGRSSNFMIDRFHMFLGNHPDGTNENVPESLYDDASTYCASATSSTGCVGWMAKHGAFASASNSGDFVLEVPNVDNNAVGILFYGYQQGNFPAFGGTLCVDGPLIRSNVLDSGGTPTGNDCSGTLRVDFNEVMQRPGHQIAPGTTVYAQYAYRDSGSGSGARFTNAIRFTVQN